MCRLLLYLSSATVKSVLVPAMGFESVWRSTTYPRCGCNTSCSGLLCTDMRLFCIGALPLVTTYNLPSSIYSGKHWSMLRLLTVYLLVVIPICAGLSQGKCFYIWLFIISLVRTWKTPYQKEFQPDLRSLRWWQHGKDILISVMERITPGNWSTEQFNLVGLRPLRGKRQWRDPILHWTEY